MLIHLLIYSHLVATLHFPAHTLIGLVKLVSKIEDSEFESILTPSNPTLKRVTMSCRVLCLSLTRTPEEQYFKGSHGCQCQQKRLDSLDKDKILVGIW